MTPERQAQLEQLEIALAPFTASAFNDGRQQGIEQGYIFAVQDMEAEVARMADTGTLTENEELAGALAKAAGWLRRLKSK